MNRNSPSPQKSIKKLEAKCQKWYHTKADECLVIAFFLYDCIVCVSKPILFFCCFLVHQNLVQMLRKSGIRKCITAVGFGYVG